ncbi:MAG: hypothetical protein V8Q30_08780 [Acutalibacteraceae bacterium]
MRFHLPLPRESWLWLELRDWADPEDLSWLWDEDDRRRSASHPDATGS